MNRRELAKNAFLGLCGALLGKKIKAPIEPPDAPVPLSHSTGYGKWIRIIVVRFPEHPAGSTEPFPPGWDFLNDPEEDVYNE